MGRSPCCDKNGLKKGPWTTEEDAKLVQYIQTHSPGNWRTLPKNAGLQRCGKSCRLRWTNYLRPDIKRGRFSFEEEETIIQLHSVLGNKWSAIAARLPGRTDNEIKNYWNTHIRKRLLRSGIDPVTHGPRLDFLDFSSLLSSPQINFSSLLHLQTLLNPQALKLALAMLTSESENFDILLQKLKENHLALPDSHLLQSQPQFLQQQQPNHFETIINLPSSFNNHNTSLQGVGSVDCKNLTSQVFQQDKLNSCDEVSFYNLPSVGNDGIHGDLLENSGLNSWKMILDSGFLTHRSSFSAGMSDGVNEKESLFFFEQEKESLLRFEIPEGLDLDEFIM